MIDTQIVRFSVKNGQMARVLAGEIRHFTWDRWRVDGILYIGKDLILCDEWHKGQTPAQNKQPVAYGKITRILFNSPEPGKCTLYFEVLSVVN